MSYPPEWRRTEDESAIRELVAEFPFAHLFTAEGGLRATRIPFVADFEEGRLVRLRGHLNGSNPQAKVVGTAELLIVFSGPHSYVSPNWRTDRQRAATFDYEEVRVRGRATIEPEQDFFVALVDDLARQIEPQYAEIGDYPVWQSAMAPDGYLERLFPFIVAFSVRVEDVEMISKLHQPFPVEDRRSIAEHLSRSSRSDSRTIAERIRRLD